MSHTAIKVDQISKSYVIGARQEAYPTLRNSLTAAVKAPFRAIGNRKNRQKAQEERTVWALRDVSFEVEAGKVVGVIGRNGAGKSTLLKVLSRITDPTSGTADVYGRLGSLLEVGTGFHLELTGRENIYLNGAILGMRRADISRQFDRIVAFAEVERYIDTAVKHYSSGMYMRLAFAVAAHLEPDILLVDEVLAVGDVAFQRKCLGRIGEVGAEGRTVLFISHNMGAVRALCSEGIVLDAGEVRYAGDIGKSIETYFGLTSSPSSRTADGVALPGFGTISVTGSEGTIEQGEAFEVCTTLQVPAQASGFSLVCVLEDPSQRNIFHLTSTSSEFKLAGPWQDIYAIRLRLPALWLEPGLYSLWIKAVYWGESVQTRSVSDILHLDVSGNSSGRNTVLSPPADWSIEPVRESMLI